MVKLLSISLILLAIIAITYGRSTEYKINDLELSNKAKTYEREDEAGFEASLHLNIGANANSEDDNTGEGNTGEGNTGKGNTGKDNTGEDNTGEGNTDGVENLQDVIKNLKEEFKATKSELESVIEATKSELESVIEATKSELESAIEASKDRITRLENKTQMLTPEPTTPEPTTPESTTPAPTTQTTTPEPKLSDEERIQHCGLINSMEDESITASSVFRNNPFWGPQHSRLYSVSGGGWLARTYEGSWIEIDMGTKKTVKGVATQGSSRSYNPYWIKSFTIGFKTSTSSSFQNIEDQSGAKKIFQGNWDMNTVFINDVDVEGRFIRIYPISWNGNPILRFDVLLC